MNSPSSPEWSGQISNAIDDEPMASSQPFVTTGQEREPAPPPATEGPALDANALAAMTSELGLLSRLMSETVRLGRDRERVLDRLHDENQKLRAGELDRALSPILRDLVRLRDDLAMSADRWRRVLDDRTEQVALELDGFRDSVVDILYRQGCEPYAPAIGDRFDAKEHRPSSVREIGEAASDASVAEVLRPGFHHNGRILRPAHVVVNRCTVVSVPLHPNGEPVAPVEAPPASPMAIE